ncbi:MAG TPA: IS481 family transposase [Acidimicrobiales bacterium]|nr:IS481 family transposase [Acidimicrobiales bacterium]
MLKELSKVEQRYNAVLAVIRDGMRVVEVAEKFGVHRDTVHVWLARYEAGGLTGLADRSHRPRNSPLQMSAAIEARVLELRRWRPHWGPMSIRHQLAREQAAPLPSVSGIYRALRRHGLVESQERRKRLPTYKRWERGRPMELWQMDVVGGVLLADGTECKVLTGVDDHSRFCVCAGIMVRATARPVCGFFAEALERHGVPEEVLTDNAKVFTNRFALRPTEVLFDKLCRENGIVHRLTAPRSPTTTGKIERFHRTLRVEFLSGRMFPSLNRAQAELDAWVVDYNTCRPHQSLKMQTPSERFTRREAVAEPPLDLRALEQDRSGDDWISRTVSLNGTVSVSNQVFSVGKHRGGSTIDVRVTEELLEAWDGMDLLKTVLRSSKGVVRKKRAELHVKH